MQLEQRARVALQQLEGLEEADAAAGNRPPLQQQRQEVLRRWSPFLDGAVR